VVERESTAAACGARFGGLGCGDVVRHRHEGVPDARERADGDPSAGAKPAQRLPRMGIP